jgi:hypothetical protein
MPKRPQRSEKGSSKASGPGGGTKTAAQDARRDSDGEPSLPKGAAVAERGAFAVAGCDRCGWQGPARRSRDRARKDLRQHLEDKPKHADHVSLTDLAG